MDTDRMGFVSHSPIFTLLYLVTVTFMAAAPLWLPLTFLAYVMGRRQMSMQLFFFFVTVEAICIAVVTAFLWSPLSRGVY